MRDFTAKRLAYLVALQNSDQHEVVQFTEKSIEESDCQSKNAETCVWFT